MLSRRHVLTFAGTLPICLCCWPSVLLAEEAEPRVCTELFIADLNLAFEIAIDENPANDPATSGLPRSEAISLFAKKWHPERRILNVSFLEEPNYLDKVISYARAWEPYIGMRFMFGNSDPDILVAFDRGGSWSYLGTDSRYFASRGRPSMNFGWYDSQTRDEEFSRTTIHEFGHALSLVHEHFHPESGISWNKEKVYTYYNKRGWNRDRVDAQIFGKYELSQINGSGYDPKSIMHYPIDESLITDKTHAVGWNTELSELDKATIAAIYPKPQGLFPD